ncbi:MAG: hypothetical protein MJZ96_01665 [Paludibacteraceae bacterium]|nr:hypothetical protein [Paludibacteraceae bacterium]
MTTLEALKSAVNNYPYEDNTIMAIAIERGLDHGSTFTTELAKSKEYQLAKADCIRYVLGMVNLAQSGASVTQTDIRAKISIANAIYRRLGEPLIQDTDGVRPTVTIL